MQDEPVVVVVGLGLGLGLGLRFFGFGFGFGLGLGLGLALGLGYTPVVGVLGAAHPWHHLHQLREGWRHRELVLDARARVRVKKGVHSDAALLVVLRGELDLRPRVVMPPATIRDGGCNPV